MTVTLSADVLSDFGKATLTPEATARIEGHTDAIGSDADNLALSEQRAAAVRDALVAGVPGLATGVTGRGETQPAAYRSLINAVLAAPGASGPHQGRR